MSPKNRTIERLVAAAAVATVAVAVPVAAVATAGTPKFATNGVSHISGTSAQLEGTVTPEGQATSYLFEYGPTAGGPVCAVPMANKTKPVAVPIPTLPAKTVKVGQPVTGLLTGYHYRIIGFYTVAGKTEKVCGKEATFSNRHATQLKFSIPKEKEDRVFAVYGGSAELVGTLKGSASASHGLTVQAKPYPFTGPFTAVPGSTVTSRSGSFSFRVSGLTENMEYRFLTVDARPAISPTIAVHVIPKITLHVKRGGKTRLYRLYGTVTPARNGAGVTIQQLLPQKPGSKREGPRPHSVGTTVLKRATSHSSRFSVVVRLAGSYRYRAAVRLPKGALESGNSSNVLIKAPPGTIKSHK
jgi:hypothetical protein